MAQKKNSYIDAVNAALQVLEDNGILIQPIVKKKTLINSPYTIIARVKKDGYIFMLSIYKDGWAVWINSVSMPILTGDFKRQDLMTYARYVAELFSDIVQGRFVFVFHIVKTDENFMDIGRRRIENFPGIVQVYVKNSTKNFYNCVAVTLPYVGDGWSVRSAPGGKYLYREVRAESVKVYEQRENDRTPRRTSLMLMSDADFPEDIGVNRIKIDSLSTIEPFFGEIGYMQK